MELYRIRYFSVVAETGSFTKAATRASASTAKIEEELGGCFVRSTPIKWRRPNLNFNCESQQKALTRGNDLPPPPPPIWELRLEEIPRISAGWIEPRTPFRGPMQP
jgi:hypothetical protein